MPRPVSAAVTDLSGRTDASRRNGAGFLSQKAYLAIKRMVLENKVHGGEYLLEEELAKTIGMSRTPLREACVQLQNEGLVQIVPRRGIRIVPLTVADMREVYELLEWLESQAAHALSLRKNRGMYVKELRSITRRMQTALAEGDVDAWAKLNDHFHIRLVSSAGNGRLSRICENLLDQSQRVRSFTLRLRKTPTHIATFHAAMIDAIEEGDADKAATIQRDNKRAWLSELEEIIERLQIRYL